MDREITKLSAGELDDVVKIHMVALPDDVLPKLGKQTLINYYESVLADKSQHLFGVVSDKRVLGFCLVSIGRIGLWRLFCSFRGLFSLVTLMACHPRIFYSGVKQAMRTLPLDTGAAEISFIAVAPACQGMGLGKSLLDYAIQICKDEKVATMQTKTSNQQLRDFYLHEYGAVEVDGYAVDGKRYSLLRWSTNFTGS